MGSRRESDRIIRDHVVWSMAGGLVPIPLADVAAVSAVQLDMLSKLATEHGVRFKMVDAKSLVTALVGGGAARLGANLLKLVPGVGTVLGGLSMAVAAGASTYAVGQVAVNEFSAGRGLGEVDLDRARELYARAFEEGKDKARNLAQDSERMEVFEKLERLAQLKDEGILSEDEFKLQKQKLLERI